MFTNPTLMILAGGASSRMWPIREKSLLRFGVDPLLISQLKRYYALGFRDVIVIANPDSYAEVAALTQGIDEINVRVAVQERPKGMGDAILSAVNHLNNLAAPLYITQVHDVVDDALHADILSAFQRDPSASYVAGVEMEDYFPGGYLIVNGDGRITGIVEKPGAENRPSKLVNIVAHLYANSADLVDALRSEYAREISSDDHYERAMDQLMLAHTFRVVPYHGAWAALKYPWHVLDVMNVYLQQIHGQIIEEGAYIAPTATLRGDVYIGAGARVFPGAAVVGPAYIGAHTVVGNNALVRHSMVLEHCEVGFTTEIARSYVADHVSMHACRVLDSVFMRGVNFSAGCTTANLRMDRGIVTSRVKGQKLITGRDKLGAVVGQDAFLSVDVMTMPGVKIGARAQVGPGTHVHQDVLDGQRVYVKQEVVVVEHDA